mmetsp:Transcript_15497/g.42361  ORF Transcript_15497/g.42361 Transcript_15497/m.42361 type:complete len:201 (-) Transcript_15497:54-656(-)
MSITAAGFQQRSDLALASKHSLTAFTISARSAIACWFCMTEFVSSPKLCLVSPAASFTSLLVSLMTTSMSTRIAPPFKRRHPITNSSIPSSLLPSTSRSRKRVKGSVKCSPMRERTIFMLFLSNSATNSCDVMVPTQSTSMALKISVSLATINFVSSKSSRMRKSMSMRVVAMASFTNMALITLSTAKTVIATKKMKIHA